MGLFERSRISAKPGWSRWLVPPAALAIHLSIGQVYAWSVFKNPLEKSLHLTGSESALPFQLGILVLGLSAAFGGKLVEHKGPRWAMFVATIAFSAGFLISALGMQLSQFWLVVVGYGLVGGIGLGIGYIAPVSALMKWFPDRPGMATGIAIMGFGGGALIASPWSTQMLAMFGKDTGGIAATFLVHGIVYAVFMTLGVLLIRLPAPGWKPAGWEPKVDEKKTLVTTANVSATNATKTPQFWLLWVVLCLNVTAGIGVLEKASPMIQDYFKSTSTPVTAAAAAGFVALLSLANMGGRFVWSTLSDLVGRKNIYRFYLGFGIIGYLILRFEASSSVLIFVATAMLILSFYGGGFSTVPAYLKDLFGTFEVGAIHGRLLTAWSVAGVAGPAIVDAIADAGKKAGNSGPDLYATSFYIMIALLVIGLVANELIRPVNPRFHERPAADAVGPGGSEAAELPTDGKAAHAATAESDSADAAKAESAPADAITESADAEAETPKAPVTTADESNADKASAAKVTAAATSDKSATTSEQDVKSDAAKVDAVKSEAAESDAVKVDAAKSEAATEEAADRSAENGKVESEDDTAAAGTVAESDDKPATTSSRTSAAKTATAKTTTAKTTTAKTTTAKTTRSRTSTAKNGTAKNGTAKNGTAKNESAKTTRSRTGTAKSAAAKTAADNGTDDNGTENGAAENGASDNGNAENGAAKSTRAKTTRARSTTAAKTTAAKTTAAKTTAAKTTAAKTTAAKTTAAKTTAAKKKAAKPAAADASKTESAKADEVSKADSGTGTSETAEDTVSR